MSLFDSEPISSKPVRDKTRPLADRMRPETLEEFTGQEHILGPGKPLRAQIERDSVTSIILWGPPGVGKTTLGRLIARMTHSEFLPFSAVLSGIKEIKAVMADAERLRRMGRRTILFIDEIHRFNKAQQDAFLPYVETGDIILIGATTENPSFEVNAALLSRSKVFSLRALTVPEIVGLLARALTDRERGLGDREISAAPELLEQIAIISNGDARAAYNTLEAAVASAIGPELTPQNVEDSIQRKVLLYDKSGEEHFNLISALHKSVRSSDADAALYWLARMLEAGEDRLYIARRLVRMAIEDIGLADPRALEQAIAAKETVHFLGIPEGDLALAQLTHLSRHRAQIGRVIQSAGRSTGRRAQQYCRAGSDASSQRSYASNESVGLRRGLSARAPVRRRDGRYGVPASVVSGPGVVSSDRSRRRETNRRTPGGNPHSIEQRPGACR